MHALSAANLPSRLASPLHRGATPTTGDSSQTTKTTSTTTAVRRVTSTKGQINEHLIIASVACWLFLLRGAQCPHLETDRTHGYAALFSRFLPSKCLLCLWYLAVLAVCLGRLCLGKETPAATVLGTRLQGKTTLVKVRVAFWLGLCHRYESRITEEIPARLITLTWQ